MTRRPIAVAAAALALAVLGASCDGNGGAQPTSAPGTTAGTVDASAFVAQVASSDLYVDAPQRLQVGVFANDPEEGVLLVTSGEVSVSVAPFGDGPGTPFEGTARYVPAPGTGEVVDAPRLTTPNDGRGVYEIADAVFDAAGVWQATVAATVEGTSIEVVATPFNVATEPAYPAPGDRSPATQNLTLEDTDEPPEALDSRAQGGADVPDPELHRWTVANALDANLPIVAIFATPTYCQSLFCGPVTDAVSELAETHADKAVFVHVEIWHRYDTELNDAAIEWLYRDGNLTEPWLFLIDARGRIVDRWAPLFDPEEIAAVLEEMPVVDTEPR